MTEEQSVDSELEETRPYTASEIRDMIEGTELLRFSEGTGRHEGRVMAVFDARDRQEKFGDSDTMGGVGVTFEIEGSNYPDKKPVGKVVDTYGEVNRKPATLKEDPISGETDLTLGKLPYAYIKFEDGTEFRIKGTNNLGIHEVEV